MIHGENDLLDKLLFIMSRENRLRTVIDEQNNLYQVRKGERERERRGREGGGGRRGERGREGGREG